MTGVVHAGGTARRFLLSLVCGMFLADVAIAQHYYESNATGVAVAPISAKQTGDFPFVLVVEEEGGETISRLLEDGNEVKRVETTRSESGVEESTYKNGAIVSSIRYLEGVPVEERVFSPAGLRERYEYTYTEGRLVSTSVFDGEGTLLRSVSYHRIADGRMIRSILATGSEKRLTLYRYDGDDLYEAWLGDGTTGSAGEAERGTLYRYSGNELTGIERWDGDSLLRTETVTDTESGSTKTIEEVDSGKTIVESYDPAGRLLKKVVSIGTARVESTRYRYANGYANGNLTESTRVFSGGSEQHRYGYDEDGALSTESVYRNGELQKVIVWTDKDTRYEDIYRSGTAVLRVHFENDQKVNEEILK